VKKRHEVCKSCRFAAPCYGLGLQLVLQMSVDCGQWLGSTLPRECPQFEPREWQPNADSNG